MRHYLNLILKGIAMGAANVIPGVSGGTIAFITGIYEELIDSLKSFDLRALSLALRLRVREFVAHVNLRFLVPLFLGIGVSLVTLGKALDWLFTHHPVPVWSFFFGLILASVYFVSKNIKKWRAGTVAAFIVGVALALSLAFMKPAAEDASFLYLTICGIVAICSMLLPGLSGSFVLILMGNYQLIMLQAVPDRNLGVIIPVGIGAMIGFILLSHIISYLLRHHHDNTLSVLTGFILGSLVIIWPWKSEILLLDEQGLPLLKDGEKIVQGYDWLIPSFNHASNWLAVGMMLVGIVAVALLEQGAAGSPKSKKSQA